MKVIHDFRGIGKKNCGIRHSAIFYLKALTKEKSNDYYLFNSGTEDIIKNVLKKNNSNFLFTKIGKYSILNSIYFPLKFGFKANIISYHSSLPLFYFNSGSSTFICHDLFSIDDPNFFNKYSIFKKKLAISYFSLLLNYSLNKASRVIVPSPYVKKTILARYPYLENKIDVNYSPGPRVDFSVLKKISHKKTDVFSNLKISLFYIGNLRSYKGFFDFYSHFQKLDPNKFELIIITSDDLYKQLQIKNNLKIFYRASDLFKEYCYSKCDLVIIPSRFEGFCLPVLDAVYRNCNILLSKSKSFKHFKKLNINTFDFNSVDSIENKILDSVNESKKSKEERKIIANKIFSNELILKKFKMITQW